MTFRAERYPADWRAVSRAVRERAGNVCEQCRAPNGQMIVRDPLTPAVWYGLGDCLAAETGSAAWIAGHARKAIRVVLTVAHLDHNEGNNDPSNLRALCQRCHLNHDREDNRRRARERKHGAKAIAELPFNPRGVA